MVFFGWKMVLRRGDPIAQIEFMRMLRRPSRSYGQTGRYQDSREPTAARSPRT